MVSVATEATSITTAQRGAATTTTSTVRLLAGSLHLGRLLSTSSLI